MLTVLSQPFFRQRHGRTAGTGQSDQCGQSTLAKEQCGQKISGIGGGFETFCR
jgi:hypothetical protein